MKKSLFASLLFAGTMVSAQNVAKDAAVRVWAEPNINGTVELKWEDFGHNSAVKIFKKSINSQSWTSVATLGTSATSYTISAQDAQVPQEWWVNKNFFSGSQLVNYADGYIFVGVNKVEKEFMGHCLLLISQKANDSLSNEIGEAYAHVIADGWQTDTMVLSESLTDVQVKQKISTWYNLHPSAEHCLFIFGHLAVPYSGLMLGGNNQTVPADGHTPDHEGAWVCDGFYADINGLFTDNGTSNAANRAANKNNPNDGKWDQINLPSLAEIQVGRVDLNDIPTLGTEIQLLRRYLQKLKTYKLGQAEIPMKGLVDDRLGMLGIEAPGRPAWMYMTPLLGKDNIETGNLISNGRAKKYMFSHEVSTGGYTQYVNIASTSTFNDSFNAVFNSSFGSYFGDWDITNNILRAAVAAPGFSLTNCWNGRPLMLFHHMSMGENIGYSIRAMINNNVVATGEYTYQAVFMQGRAHQSLIGDPTLRMQMIKPPTAPTTILIDNDSRVKLDWTASADNNIIGYNIYSSASYNGIYKKINSNKVVGNTFTDNNPITGTNFYLIRAVKLDSNASGSYYNQSLGAMVKASNVVNNIEKLSLPLPQIVGYPNPASDMLHIDLLSTQMKNAQLSIKNIDGKEVYKGSIGLQSNIYLNLSSGVYVVNIISNNFAPFTSKLVIR